MTILLVAIGAAVGAPMRYVTDRAIQRRLASAFPWGTLTVNVIGSAIFGAVMAAAAVGGAGDGVVAALGFGLCGGLTTYSTFSYETLRLLEGGAGSYAVANVAVHIAAGIGAAAAGWAIATAAIG